MELINTLEAPGEFDALSTLRPGEPYFLLVGRDRFAPGLVQSWAEQNRKRAFEDAEAGRINGDQLATELRKSTQAEAIGWSMTAFKKGVVAPPPDAPKRAVDTTCGSKLPADTVARDRLRTAQSRAVSALHNAIAELEGLIAVQDGPVPRFHLAQLEAAAEQLAPARPGIEQEAAE